MSDQTPGRGSRIRRIVLWTVGLLVGAPLALVALALVVLLVGANTGPGRRLIEQQAAALSGGLLRLSGLGGRFPDDLRVGHVEVHDHLGTWLTLDGIRLDWHPLALLGRTARIDLASIDRIAVARRPVPDPNAKPAPPSKPGGSSVPNFAIDLRRLHVGALDVAAPVTGLAAEIGIDGHVQVAGIAPLLSGVSVATLPDSDIALDVRRLDHPGAVSLTTMTTSDRLGLHLRADDPQGGMVTVLAALPMLDPLTLSLDLDGPRDGSAVDLALHAGPVSLAAQGTADLLTQHFDLRTTGRAPAMEPRPGIALERAFAGCACFRHAGGAGWRRTAGARQPDRPRRRVEPPGRRLRRRGGRGRGARSGDIARGAGRAAHSGTAPGSAGTGAGDRRRHPAQRAAGAPG